MARQLHYPFVEWAKLPTDQKGKFIMEIIATQALPMAAAGYSLVYLLGGGGIFGAIVIFIVAKMLGR
jgi:hypothetical protein